MNKEGEVPSGSGVTVDPEGFQNVLDQAIDYVRQKRSQLEKQIREEIEPTKPKPV